MNTPAPPHIGIQPNNKLFPRSAGAEYRTLPYSRAETQWHKTQET
ncbi:hypothetical protein BRCON_0327 [Candidatus Sumerlaea chitinivorans]|uniref:Uncharacterized protein n=1 Tax=Sumerlaea chitinivorans TaxID=2250252 RepID=A0A2Z4Y242_SUMC1|nr:hypothetical protein BRCON_0327 [Candidatus Sumerlaea chitinivorans]